MKKQINIYMEKAAIMKLDNMITRIKAETRIKWSRGDLLLQLITIYGSELEKNLSSLGAQTSNAQETQ